MGTFVTPSGFVRKTLQEIRTEIETALKTVFGPDFDTTVDSPNGLLISQLALASSHWFEAGQEIYSAHDPDQATGVSLDILSGLSGIQRRLAMACYCDAMVYTLAENAVIPQGSQALRSRGNLSFSLQAPVNLSRINSQRIIISETSGHSAGTELTFQFTFGTVTFTPNATQTTLEALRIALMSSTYSGESLLTNGELNVFYNGYETPLGVVNAPSGFDIYAGTLGRFEADEVGYQTLSSGELSTILIPVSDWDRVYNYLPGISGTEIETDKELRIRRELSVNSIKAKGTDEAIQSHLLDDVPGVISAKTTSNRNWVTDESGRPPKSSESVVIGGSDYDVAMCIWNTIAAGIQPFGNTEVFIQDTNNEIQLVGFSRPVSQFLWIKIDYQLYSEETFPGEESLRTEILDWSKTEYTIGKDVIPDRVCSGIYKVPGIGQTVIQVALTDNLEDTPVYTSQVIPVDSTSYADLIGARIILNRM